MPALQRLTPLLTPEARYGGTAAGYLDVLGDDGAPPSTGLVQDLMLSRAIPAVYERLWRPAWGRLLTGFGPDAADERRIARLLLGLTPGDGVLDVACGPGNFTRDFGRVVGEDGLAVGLDASATMLARAVTDTPAEQHPAVAYVRGDVAALPFRDASFDAVCCFAALNLFADPWAALDELVRVLTPGGRVALFTSCAAAAAPVAALERLAGSTSGMRIFGRDELAGALGERGLVDVHQRIHGVTQFVGARTPG